MENIYLVKCPHVGCDWFGILPRNAARGCGVRAAANVALVMFQCPGCRRDWQARIVGDDIETLPLDRRTDDREAILPFGLEQSREMQPSGN